MKKRPSYKAVIGADHKPTALRPTLAPRDATTGTTGAGVRMLIYSHDTFGLGHLQRCLKISRELVAGYPELCILLATGSPCIDRFEIPPRVRIIKLPPVKKTGPEKYEARNPGMSFEHVLNQRTALLLKTVKKYDPGLVLVDHAPIGMKGEMLPALTWHKENSPASFRILGLRDIIDDPDAVVSLWERQDMYRTIDRVYDKIMIYGSADLFDPVAAYRFPAALKDKTVFTNYIGQPGSIDRPAHTAGTDPSRRPKVLVTIGGGDGAGAQVIGPFLDMLESYRAKVNFDSLILSGPFMDEGMKRDFSSRAEALGVKFSDFIKSTREPLMASDLVVSTGGYNSLTEILSFAGRALIIPRVMHRKEQLMRARMMTEVGLVDYLHPQEVTPDRLFDKISGMLEVREEPLTLARKMNIVKLDGAARLARLCQPLIATFENSRKIAHG